VIWRKLGRVYVARGEREWAASHAYLPTAMMLDDDRIRVYAAFRDRAGAGRVGYVDVDARDPLTVLEVSPEPVLDIGEPGMFDDNGVTPLSVCPADDGLRLYYAGWQLGVHVRYFLFAGLAVSEDGGQTFRRHARVPVLDRSDAEPLVRTGSCVLHREGRWEMWYAGGSRFLEVGGKSRPTYELRHLVSDDGIAWGPTGEVCLKFANSDEYGFGRPSIIEDHGRLRMWYSIRSASNGYRLGYAESDDGRLWERLDEQAGLDVSAAGWDSEMVGLACVQPTRHGTYLFYNGNGLGETGFGVAIAEEW
jgi:predicted GH43/DUF377 family glycosyl hydrolase